MLNHNHRQTKGFVLFFDLRRDLRSLNAAHQLHLAVRKVVVLDIYNYECLGHVLSLKENGQSFLTGRPLAWRLGGSNP